MTGPGKLIRRLGRDDVRLLQQLGSAIRAEQPPLDYCRELLEDPRIYVIAATVGQTGAGWAIAHRRPRWHGGELLLDELDVLEPFRRQGLARAMLTGLRDLARQDGGSELLALTSESNVPAMRLYAACGGTRGQADEALWAWSLDA